jgi:UDP-N-acetylglucosamine--N-acetylmuramyl-(pentapeptide) pyrophosphoryl-undecaprenol N-acetylglucosamine transferase
MKRALIAAGGTGGHFYPGLVVAQTLKARGWEPVIVVKKDDPAKALLDKEDLAWTEVDLRGLPRGLSPQTFIFAAKLAASLGLLSRAVRDFRPDLIVGMGGYLTFPAAYAAWRRGVPCALHESNSILGLANWASVKFGAKLFWGLPSMAGGTLVGTPVRPELFKRKDASASRKALGLDPKRTTVLIFGGSQGARSLNESMAAALKGTGAQVLHLAGRNKSEETKAFYQRAGVSADVRDYLNDMASAYGAADLVVCRSGASTLAELAAQRMPAVLIPYPYAAADHQNANAQVHELVGAAVRIEERELSARLGPTLGDLLKSEAKRLSMSKAYDALGLPGAAQTTDRFVDLLEKMVPS